MSSDSVLASIVGSPISAMSPRRLRVFAFDPTLARRHEYREIRELIISLPWDLDASDPDEPFLGPKGEYLEIIDYDPASGAFYEPIDLNDSRLLASAGLEPSAADPRFHQQMVYAVVMYTIANFERALGRVALWAPRGREYVPRLRIYPHALREANAYYSPDKRALLFGYFEAGDLSRAVPPGTTIFTCLSQDIIAHETCHALLDGMHPRYNESTNPDVLALHEAFADIVAIFQHFSFAEVLYDQISRTRGDLEQQSLLGELAQEFGQAVGRGAALRDALGSLDEDGVWRPKEPDPSALERVKGPHARGSILVAAVFRAFLTIYKARIADLIRIATRGTGILPEGDIHPDLTNRLANEAAKSARHVLQMSIRALDYCPPVDVTFGDYLRAMITADYDLYPQDERGYRLAVIEAFSAWGVLPDDLKIISEQTLLWPTMREIARDQGTALDTMEDRVGLLLSQPSEMLKELENRPDIKDRDLIESLSRDASRIVQLMNERETGEEKSHRSLKRLGRQFDQTILSRNLLALGLEADREVEFHAQNFYARLFWGLITDPDMADLWKLIGITQDPKAQPTIHRSKLNGLPSVHVQSVRMAVRRGKRGQEEREYVVEIVQRRRGYLDDAEQAKHDASKKELPRRMKRDFDFRRGCTLLIDARRFEIRRVICTPGTVADDDALDSVRDFLNARARRSENAFDGGGEPDLVSPSFAHLHRHYRED